MFPVGFDVFGSIILGLVGYAVYTSCCSRNHDMGTAGDTDTHDHVE